MKTFRSSRSGAGSWKAGLLALSLVAEATAQSLPAGVLDFAARLSHRHGYLLGEAQRDEIDRLNRQLRLAAQQRRNAAAPNARQAAASQAEQGVRRLLELLRQCPHLRRLDLTDAHPHVEPAGPVHAPGDTGALLLEVRMPGEGLRFSTATADFSQPKGESSRVDLDVAGTGLTYVIVGLEQLPVNRITLQLRCNRPNQPPAVTLVDVITPAHGRLRLTVLSDDSGQPVPAMVRLMWRVDGQERQPANRIEFAPQFDGQGQATGLRTANLPGPLGAPFWCVPGPFDMALAPGVWQVGVRRGVEHEVVFQDVVIRSGELTTLTIRPRRWVDMRRRGWWSGDDHVHLRILSEEDARRAMAWIQAEDVHLANIVKMGDIYRTYFEQRGFGPKHRVMEGAYVLVPGQECPRTHDQLGHVLAMNITAMVRDPERYFLYDTVFDAVHAQGGLTGYAHVNSGMFHVHRDMTLNVPRAKVDFVEILQFNRLGTDLYYDFLNLGCKLTASAGSDVPWGGTVGEVRAYAYLGDQPFTADHWFAAFARGRTFTTSGPMIEFRVDDALPGDEIVVETARPLRVQARAWGDPRRMAPVTLEVVRHGDVIAHAESTDPGNSEARLDFTVDADHGFWIAARARAADGTSAHTTPVYVTRPGLRFWKFDGLEGLLAKREESLRQIEALIAEARRLDAAGRLEADLSRKQLALQADALLERVAQARRLYAELRRLAEDERPLRAAPSG